MKLNALHLVNFRQHADTRIEFDLGLTGIIGPNGTGKTTILEAIAWALYGQPAARGTRDSIRFLRAGPRAQVRVELDFDLAGHRYRVVRGLTNAELYLDHGAEPIASTITGVTELLHRRLGMTRAEFFNTYFTGQKELNVMAAMAPTERAQFLSRVLGYDKLRTAQSLVRDRRKLVSAEMAGLRNALPDPEAVERMLAEARTRAADATGRRRTAEQARRDANAAYADVAPRWEVAQRTRDAVQQLLSELRVAQNDESSRLRDLERIDRELGGMSGAKIELVQLAAEIAPLNEVQNEFRRLEELAREEGRRQALEESARAIVDEVARLVDRREKIGPAQELEADVADMLERKRHVLDETLGMLETHRTAWVRDRQEAETKRDALRKQWGELKAQRDQIMDLGEEGVCPTCTRVLGSSFRTVLDQLEEQIDTIEVDGKYFATRLEQLEEMPEEVKTFDAQRKTLAQEVPSLERQLAQAQSSVKELAQIAREVGIKQQRLEGFRRELEAIPTGYDFDRHEVLRREVSRLAPLNERVTRLSALIEREPVLQQERGRVVAELDAVRNHARMLQARHDASQFSEEAYAALRGEYESCAPAARAVEVAEDTAKVEELRALESLTHAELVYKEELRRRDTYNHLQRDKRLHDELDRAYTDLRFDLNLQLRPELSELASSFLSDLTDARYAELELDDEYSIVVLEDGLPKPVISGGEEDLANLVLRLAISQMIAERAGQSFSLLVLDEVFGSLDDVRRHNVVGLLRRLQDRFEQVILITHIESVRDELDHAILVEYDERTGASRVRQAEATGASAPADGLFSTIPGDSGAGSAHAARHASLSTGEP